MTAPPDPTCGVGAAVRAAAPFIDAGPGELARMKLNSAVLAVRRSWRDRNGGLMAEIGITVNGLDRPSFVTRLALADERDRMRLIGQVAEAGIDLTEIHLLTLLERLGLVAKLT